MRPTSISSGIRNALRAVVLLAIAVTGIGYASAQDITQNVVGQPKVIPVQRNRETASTAPEKLTRKPAENEQSITLELGKTRLIRLSEPVRDVVVPNPKVVDVVDIIIKRPREVYLVAKAIGETNVFFIGKRGNVMLHVEAVVEIGLKAAKAAIAAAFPNGGIHLNGVNKSIVISGSVSSAQDSANAASIVRAFVQNDTDVINMLQIRGDQQVLLKVRVAEVQRTTLKNLGGSLTFGSKSNLSVVTTGALFGPAADAFGTVFANVDQFGLKNGTLSALEERGLAKTLAEPALVAISGETANFLAGGEFPVPTGRDDNNNITIEFKKFGVSLSFTPVVLSRRQINLRIKTEVSRLDPSQKLELFSTTINGLSVRRADSTVSMNSGGSIMIAGLLQNDEFNDIQGLPWFKDIPILGALFSSKGFQNNQTELVVMVTAYIARPTAPDAQLSLPTDGFVPASDFDFYLLGRLYKRYAKRVRSGAVPMVQGPVGYLME